MYVYSIKEIAQMIVVFKWCTPWTWCRCSAAPVCYQAAPRWTRGTWRRAWGRPGQPDSAWNTQTPSRIRAFPRQTRAGTRSCRGSLQATHLSVCPRKGCHWRAMCSIQLAFLRSAGIWSWPGATLDYRLYLQNQ